MGDICDVKIRGEGGVRRLLGCRGGESGADPEMEGGSAPYLALKRGGGLWTRFGHFGRAAWRIDDSSQSDFSVGGEVCKYGERRVALSGNG